VNKLAVIVLLIGLVACRGKKPEEGREPVQTAGPGTVVGSAAPAAPSPAAGGQATGNPAGAPVGNAAGGNAASSSDVGCATAATLTCEADQRDGCTDGLTSVHTCVAKDAKAGQPCAQEVALVCPAGQRDACLHNPPQATNHVCVVAPKPGP